MFIGPALIVTPVRAAPILDISNFADPPWSLTYFDGFTGTFGPTPTWPAEMGWQGDRIDVGFFVPAEIPAHALQYRFRMVIREHFDQSFDLAVQAGPSLDDLIEIQREFVDSARVVAVTIPLDRFVPNQINWLRIQGIGVEVGAGQAAGIQWSRWTLNRTDPSGSLEEVRLDQLERCRDYVLDAIEPTGLVRDSLPLSDDVGPFHPATPDAAGFALLGLCALDHLGLLTDAAIHAESILSAYAGRTEGVTPRRSFDGHWVHFMDVDSGDYAGGSWDDTYSPIGSALLVTGALFAKNHFSNHATIGELADELFVTTDFNAAIDPSLDGRIYLGMDPDGGGLFGWARPWNEYMLVVSAALRQPENDRAEAVAHLWLDPDEAPTIAYQEIPTLTDNIGSYAPAFWVHQQHFFNADFAANAGFETLFENHRQADELYCADELWQTSRYGLTAGVSPSGYTVDRIDDHHGVYSPEAVVAWGDLDTMLEFEEEQPPSGDARRRYGLHRVSSDNGGWIPYDAGLVDHLFLLFGLAESVDPLFFVQRQPFQTDDDADGIADAHDNCAGIWNRGQDDSNGDGLGDACDCTTPFADADGDGDVDLHDFGQWQLCPVNEGEVSEHCLCFDRNGDRQISALDLPDFTACLKAGGPDTPADSSCGE